MVRVADDTGPSHHEPPPTIQLIREFKRPTVDDLIRSEETLERLPVQLRRVVQAVSMSELRRAEERLDRALGQLHEGPGYRRRRRWRAARLALWLLAAALLTLVLLWTL